MDEKGAVSAISSVGFFIGFYTNMVLAFVVDLITLPFRFVILFFDFSIP